MSVVLMPKPRSSTPGHRRPLPIPWSDGRERVTINRFWPEAVPFLSLVAIVAIIVYVVTAN
jgi:hypothetical protein